MNDPSHKISELFTRRFLHNSISDNPASQPFSYSILKKTHPYLTLHQSVTTIGRHTDFATSVAQEVQDFASRHLDSEESQDDTVTETLKAHTYSLEDYMEVYQGKTEVC